MHISNVIIIASGYLLETVVSIKINVSIDQSRIFQ